MKKYLFYNKGRFFKANLHTHTTISDGKLTPEQVKKVYMESGYQIVAFTDHDVIVPHNDLNEKNFLTITSFEMYVNSPNHENGYEFKPVYHLNFYSKDPNRNTTGLFSMDDLFLPQQKDWVAKEMLNQVRPRQYNMECVNKIIKDANDEGFLVCYNHPVWSQQNYANYCDLKGLWGVECYNNGTAIRGYEDTMQPICDFLRKGERVKPLATDDAHSLADCFGGFTIITASALNYDNVMNALESGDFYASTGPTIKEIVLEDGVLSVKCSNAQSVIVNTERRASFRKDDASMSMTSAQFDLNAYLKASKNLIEGDPEPFIRVTVIDPTGKRAQTRAYFLDEFEK